MRKIGMGSLIVFVLCAFLVACQNSSYSSEKSQVSQNSQAPEKSATESEEEPLIGVYSSDLAYLVGHFTGEHPEIKIKWYSLTEEIKDAAEKYGTVDIVLCSDRMAENLESYWENGEVADITELWALDETISDEAYYQGIWEAGKVEDRLLALPISMYIPYMTVRESVWNESAFAYLPEAYTAVDLLEVMNSELAKGQEEGFEAFPGFSSWSMTDLLRMMGGIREGKEEIEIDHEVFSLLYTIFCQSQQRIEYVSFPGTYPLDNEGQFVGVCWNEWTYFDLPPQLGVVYANSAIQEDYEEGVKVVYFPTIDSSQSFSARASAFGYVYGSSSQLERAYEVLRLMMDVPITSWDSPEAVRTGSILSCPVNREAAEQLLTSINEQAAKGETSYSVFDHEQGRKKVAQYKVQPLSEMQQENILSHLDHITQVYRRSRMDVYAEINSEIWVYIRNVGLTGVDNAYDAMVKAYQTDNQ